MISDGRVFDAPRRLVMCMTCGLCMRGDGPLPMQEIYGSAYVLNDSAPGAVAADSARHQRYATWISSAARAAPAMIFEAGCGNGSLLKCLRERFPAAQMRGVDPAPRAVSRAQAAGLEVRLGDFGSGVEPPGTVDLLVAVNVIEHSSDPVAFLQTARSLLTEQGQAAIICPDGNRPSTELLFVDHLYSFTGAALSALASVAGLVPAAWPAPPEPVGAFQMMLARSGGYPVSQPSAMAVLALFDERAAYLQAWARLDDLITSRLGDSSNVVAFGAGETADLLRAYAPTAWGRVRGAVVDVPTPAATSPALPVLPYGELRPGSDQIVLLAVRPGAQKGTASRLERDGFNVVRWDDWILN
jgi:SAM-dependent methyltransferase